MDADIKQLFSAEAGNFMDIIPYLKTTTDWALYPEQVEPFREFILEATKQKKKKMAAKPDVTSPKPVVYPRVEEMEDSLWYYPCLFVDMENQVTYLKVGTLMIEWNNSMAIHFSWFTHILFHS